MSAARGNGSRSRSGCYGCRRHRKRRCDERRPVCGGCEKHKTACEYPSDSAARLRFALFVSRDHFLLPVRETAPALATVHLCSSDVPGLCRQYRRGGADDDDADNDVDSFLPPPTPLLPRRHSMQTLPQAPGSWSSAEQVLFRYYLEVVSGCRVYAATETNMFCTSVASLLLSQPGRGRGPLLSTVLAMSAAERCDRPVASAYKVSALAQLQQRLRIPQDAEENLLTCILQTSLEIAEGSRSSWLQHMEGAFAIMDSYAAWIRPESVRFALKYFGLRHILLVTTQPGRESPAPLLSSRPELTVAPPAPESDENQVADEYIGCSMELVGIISEISALSSSSSSKKNHAASIGSGKRQLAASVEARIDKLSFRSPGTEEDDYLLGCAECFKDAAKMYLRLSYLELSILHPSVTELQDVLLDRLGGAIAEGQPRRLFPMWPLFIAGCACSSDGHRKLVLRLFATLDGKWPISNIAIVYRAVWTFWQTRDLCGEDPPPVHWEDWSEMMRSFGWKISLT